MPLVRLGACACANSLAPVRVRAYQDLVPSNKLTHKSQKKLDSSMQVVVYALGLMDLPKELTRMVTQ